MSFCHIQRLNLPWHYLYVLHQCLTVISIGNFRYFSEYFSASLSVALKNLAPKTVVQPIWISVSYTDQRHLSNVIVNNPRPTKCFQELGTMLQIAAFSRQLSSALRCLMDICKWSSAGSTCDTGYLSWSLMSCHVSCQHIGNYVILADHICPKRSQESELNTLFGGTIGL